MKRFLTFIFLFVIIVAGISVNTAYVVAQEDGGPNAQEYQPLAPLPGTYNEATGETNWETYIPGMFMLLIGVAGVLAVIMIIIGGIQYMSTDAVTGKKEGRNKIWQAIVGLLIAIGAWILLNTINPNLLNFNLVLQTQPTTIPPPPEYNFCLNIHISGYNTLIKTECTTSQEQCEARRDVWNSSGQGALIGVQQPSNNGCFISSNVPPPNNTCFNVVAHTMCGTVPLEIETHCYPGQFECSNASDDFIPNFHQDFYAGACYEVEEPNPGCQV